MTRPDAANPGVQIDPSAVQTLAHGLIADLFGAGLRIQHLRAHVAEELPPELEQVADQIDKAIRDLREFAVTVTGPDDGRA